MRSAVVGVLLMLGCLVAVLAQPEPATAGPVLRVLTWPIRAPFSRRCHGRERHHHHHHHQATPAGNCAG